MQYTKCTFQSESHLTVLFQSNVLTLESPSVIATGLQVTSQGSTQILVQGSTQIIHICTHYFTQFWRVQYSTQKYTLVNRFVHSAGVFWEYKYCTQFSIELYTSCMCVKLYITCAVHNLYITTFNPGALLCAENTYYWPLDTKLTVLYTMCTTVTGNIGTQSSTHIIVII